MCTNLFAVYPLTVDFIPVTDCVKLATPLCFLHFSAPIYSNNTVEVSLRPSDGTQTHDLFDVTLGLRLFLVFPVHCGVSSSSVCAIKTIFRRYRSTQPSNRPSHEDIASFRSQTRHNSGVSLPTLEPLQASFDDKHDTYLSQTSYQPLLLQNLKRVIVPTSFPFPR